MQVALLGTRVVVLPVMGARDVADAGGEGGEEKEENGGLEKFRCEAREGGRGLN
jgi:hypothetical protein